MLDKQQECDRFSSFLVNINETVWTMSYVIVMSLGLFGMIFFLFLAFW